jgi:hypothetical protein
MFLYQTLIVSHVVFTTAGYMGLIATNAWLLFLCRSENPNVVIGGVQTWRAIVRIFGPLLGVGLLFGIALALNTGIPLWAPWLLVSYVLIVAALGTQAAIMVPWQIRAQGILTAGGRVATQPIATVITIFCTLYVGLLMLMLLR